MLQIQLSNHIVGDLQNQIINITANNPPDNDEPETGTVNSEHNYYFHKILKLITHTKMWK